MAQDLFAILGLAPGRHAPPEIATRFLARRERLLGQLSDPTRHQETRRQLDDLHLAYATLRDPASQAQYLRSQSTNDDPAGELCVLIRAAIEDGLLRHSRRQEIIERGRELGLSDFQTQLLIAQVQFGDDGVSAKSKPQVVRRREQDSRIGLRAVGVGTLALAMFLFAVRWLGI